MPQIQILKQIDPQSDLFDQKNQKEEEEDGAEDEDCVDEYDDKVVFFIISFLSVVRYFNQIIF